MATYKIYPPIGIARIGDSPDEWFIGPEIPGAPNRPASGYKSADCRIKRQGARFRIYECDDAGQPVVDGGQFKEITAAQAEITWSVQLGNIKASSPRFLPVADAVLRNASTTDRGSLEILTEQLSVSGPDQKAVFAQGKFRTLPVPLGELRTDAEGRLIVLGGHGLSRAVHPDGTLWPESSVPQGLNSYDVDDWHDDVSDGPVTATLVVDGQSFTATPARVIVAPPDYAPSINAPVTMFDRLRALYFDNKVFLGDLQLEAKPSFNREIQPLLARARDIRRVFPMAGHHGSLDAAAGDPLSAEAGFITGKLLPQGAHVQPNAPPGTSPDMPKLKDDDKSLGFSLTSLQHQMLDAWAKGAGGNWVNDWTGAPPPPALVPTPDGLTRAALDGCIGEALRPGIEAGRFLIDISQYAEAFRLKPGIAPGAVIAQMALPWQGDFFACQQEGDWGWWPSQRPDAVFPAAGGAQTAWFDNAAGPDGKINADLLIEVWNQLGFVVAKDGGALVETERTIACRNISIVALREAVAETQVETALGQPAPNAGLIAQVLSVRVGGCTPQELGIKTTPVPPDQWSSLALTLFRADGSAFGGFSPKISGVELQSANLAQVQIVAFTVDLVFSGTDAFFAAGAPVESQLITVAASIPWSGETSGTATGDGQIELTNIVSPYIEVGATAWLADDLRVFKVAQGGSIISGVPVIGSGADAPLTYIGQLVDRLNALNQASQPQSPANPFDGFFTDQQDSALELYSATEAGTPVFDFAVARVTFKGKVDPAQDVRVFFRLFTTAATGMAFDTAHAYRRSADVDAPVPLLGLDAAGNVVTMPCFGRKRVDSASQSMTGQLDDLNVRTLDPPPPGQSVTYAYFGCWLDINQPAAEFQKQPFPADGPWPPTPTDPTGGRQSLQTLINGEHQCLVAEVAFRDQPIKPGATPGGDNRLAQRNLAWVASDNPGGPDTRTVQHSFTIKAPPRGDRAPLRPDEVVIHWRGLPAGSRILLYMPEVEAGAVLAIAGRTMDYTGLRRIDAHTLECLAGEVTYVPIPAGGARDIAALLSIVLPEGVRRGQAFNCVVDQVSGARRRVIGSFQLNIPISVARSLLGPEKRRLSLIRYIASAKAADDPWRAVFVRLLAQIEGRVRGFGGDPDSIVASPSGAGGKGMACRMLGALFAVAVMALVVLGGLAAGWSAPTVIAGVVGVVLTAVIWLVACKPPPQRLALMLGAGAAAGAGLLGVLALIGLGGPDLLSWLAAAAAGGVFTLLAALPQPKPGG